MGINSTTRKFVLSAHRVPLQLLGIVPATTGGFGDVTEATDACLKLEMESLPSVFLELNDQAGFGTVRFRKRVRTVGANSA